jgi:CBS domain-containing protein
LDMSIEAILHHKGRNVVTIEYNAPLRRAAERLAELNIAALVVTRGNTILGIISEREIARAIPMYGDRISSITVSALFARNVVTISPDDNLIHAMNLMTRHRTRHLLVLRDGELVGIVSIGDVVKHRLNDLELETNVLRDLYIAAH